VVALGLTFERVSRGQSTTLLQGAGMSIAYPFTAIVAQDDMKRALTIAAVDPGIGGVLVLGERGTANQPPSERSPHSFPRSMS